MAERYKIYEKLGAGGVGAVFRAYDSQLKRWVAVKRLLTANEAAQDKDIAAELRREADALASMRNPNIVTIFDVASDDEGMFMVMELLQGEDLADVVARGPLPYDDFKELASQTLEGLLDAHQHHILHRDIKPENIKVERLPGGRMQSKIIDFGLARAGLRARKQTEDQEGTVMGSIYYMAPEQLTREPVDERTDLYSLGCVFYEALSGRKAFDGESMADVIDKHIDHVVTPLHVIAPHVPQWLGAWCARLMAQKPEDRPASAQQAIEEFRAWEKMPTMVPYGPWMGMYAQQPPAYMAPPQAYMPPGTGTVPLTDYYPSAEAVPEVYAEPVAVPVEIIPEVQPLVETAAITTPLAPSPRRPGTGPAVPQPRQPSTTLAPKRTTSPKESRTTPAKIIALATSGLLLLVAIIWLLFGGSGTKTSSPTPAASSSTTAGPPKVTFQLPQDRAFPPVDGAISLFFVGNTGSLANRKGADGKLAAAGNNEAVVEWHDISERGGDNLLISPNRSTEHAPKRVYWPEAKMGGTPKPSRVVLDFHPRNGKPCALELTDMGKESANLPFGSTAAVGGDAGMTIAVAFQADAAKLPTRVFTLGNEDGTTVSLSVDTGKNLVAEVHHSGGSPKLVSKDVNGTVACTAFITWNKSTGTLELHARDANGKAALITGGKSKAPSKPLHQLHIGRITNDKGVAVPPQEQFSGYLAEFFVYSIVLKANQIQFTDGRLRDYYFQPAPPAPLKTRIKTKLPWIEPRSAWKLTSSHKKEECAKAVDDNPGSRWQTGTPMKGGEWFKVELPSETDIAGIVLDSQGSPTDYAREYKIELSTDGAKWGAPAAQGKGGTLSEILFKAPIKARFVRITQLGSSTYVWSINELVLLKK